MKYNLSVQNVFDNICARTGNSTVGAFYLATQASFCLFLTPGNNKDRMMFVWTCVAKWKAPCD